jgi:hypothetical protein
MRFDDVKPVKQKIGIMLRKVRDLPFRLKTMLASTLTAHLITPDKRSPFYWTC